MRVMNQGILTDGQRASPDSKILMRPAELEELERLRQEEEARIKKEAEEAERLRLE